jgi:dTMP kinase
MQPWRGLVAIEGIDGAGKRTQVELLVAALRQARLAVTVFSFPRYESFFGQMVGRYLRGEFGPIETVDPHFSALLYAGDRLEARPHLERALAAGHLVVADRYVGSNLAHQGGRVRAEQRAAFLAWLERLEYEIFAIPRETLVIYLRLPVEQALQRIRVRSGGLLGDLQESSRQHLEEASSVYDGLARRPDWVTVEGVQSGQARSAEDIHAEILAVLRQRLQG